MLHDSPPEESCQIYVSVTKLWVATILLNLGWCGVALNASIQAVLTLIQQEYELQSFIFNCSESEAQKLGPGLQGSTGPSEILGMPQLIISDRYRIIFLQELTLRAED